MAGLSKELSDRTEKLSTQISEKRRVNANFSDFWGDLLKFGSLMAGVYGVTSDSSNCLIYTMVAGVGYVGGGLLKRKYDEEMRARDVRVLSDNMRFHANSISEIVSDKK